MGHSRCPRTGNHYGLYLDKRDTFLKQLNALKPDLVLAGNQHSDERFHQMSPVEENAFKVVKPVSGKYRSGDGTMHIISGGGGATFKPFVDQQNKDKCTAPKDVFDGISQ